MLLTYKYDYVNFLYPFGFTEDNAPLPSDMYHFNYVEINYQSDTRRIVNIRSGFRYGGFYNGTRLETSLAANYRAQPWGNFSVNFIYNDLKFPDKFIFGTAVASYQVEGGIYNNDWTIWENRNNSVCVEPCNEACKHYESVSYTHLTLPTKRIV